VSDRLRVAFKTLLMKTSSRNRTAMVATVFDWPAVRPAEKRADVPAHRAKRRYRRT
jgi:hypothetical protein